MKRLLRRIVTSRYIHLCLGLLVLYCVSSLVTLTSRVEKILNSLKWYCIADYGARTSPLSKDRTKAAFYREKYQERLDSLTSGVFDWWDKKQMQAFLLPEGYLYDVQQEGINNSYLLAKIEGKGKYKAEVHEKVTFDYYILGRKRVVPFREYKEGPAARVFVSAGERAVYIHKDSLDPFLKWYFESLWKTEPRQPGDFYAYKDFLTISLYRDLQRVCEDIFVEKFYRDKKNARKYFVEEGFRVFLPTLLAMGARLAADKDLQLEPRCRYLRALFTGLSWNPNYTMFYLSHQHDSGNLPALKALEKFKQRGGMTDPDEITLEQISRVAQEIVEKLEESSDQDKE